MAKVQVSTIRTFNFFFLENLMFWTFMMPFGEPMEFKSPNSIVFLQNCTSSFAFATPQWWLLLQEFDNCSLRNRGLCLVPISCTAGVARSNGADIWAPIKTTSPKFEKAITQFHWLPIHHTSNQRFCGVWWVSVTSSSLNAYQTFFRQLEPELGHGSARKMGFLVCEIVLVIECLHYLIAITIVHHYSFNWWWDYGILVCYFLCSYQGKCICMNLSCTMILVLKW